MLPTGMDGQDFRTLHSTAQQAGSVLKNGQGAQGVNFQSRPMT